MILTFTLAKAGKQMVAIDGGRPMEQAMGGCRTLFDLARLMDGLSVSDEKLEGWSEQTGWNGSYVNPKIDGFGTLGLGHIETTFLDAIGFQHTKKKMYWSAGNQIHRLTAAQYKEWSKMGQEAKEVYIAGLFPAVQDSPAPKKEGKAQRVTEDIPF